MNQTFGSKIQRKLFVEVQHVLKQLFRENKSRQLLGKNYIEIKASKLRKIKIKVLG